MIYSVESYCKASCSAPPSNVVPKHVEKTLLVSAAGAQTLLAGRGVRILAAADDTVAAFRLQSVDVFDLRRHAWRTISKEPIRAARLDGTKLFVVRSKALLEVYDVPSGRRVLAEKLMATGATAVDLEDADVSFVLYVSHRTIHVRRLRDGKERILALPRSARMPLHAQIEPPGLSYSYNTAGTGPLGRVGFVARAQLIRLFGS